MGGHVHKIRILRDEHKSVVLGMLPDDALVGSIEAKISNRFGVRERSESSVQSLKLRFWPNNSFMRRSKHRAPDPPRRIGTHGCPPR